MDDNYNCNEILNSRLNIYITEMTIQQLRRSGESLFSQHQMIKERLSNIDPYNQPKQYTLINSLALKVLELSKLTIECVDEYELMDINLIIEGEEGEA